MKCAKIFVWKNDEMLLYMCADTVIITCYDNFVNIHNQVNTPYN